jgi:transposase
MKTIYVGMDVSKGYADQYIMNEAGSVLHIGQFDDTFEGHQAVEDILVSCMTHHQVESIQVGLEASGGYERNWAHFFRRLQIKYPLQVFVLNALVVKRYLSRNLHRNVTDQSSAKGIAEYLRDGKSVHDLPYSPELEGAVTFYRSLRNMISRNAMVKNEFQSLLPRVHPDLVQYSRKKIPQWVLTVIDQYPTAAKLARARVKTVAEIRYVTQGKAAKLIAAAKVSVGSQEDACTAETMRLLVRQIRTWEGQITKAQKTLIEMVGDDPIVHILESIPGIAVWTAVCLHLEIGEITRFRSPEALVAFSGLDPRVHQSGDGVQRMHISKHGRSQIRALLYCSALACLRCDPVLAEFYYRLRNRKKTHGVAITALMRKLLHIIYACLTKEQCYDPLYAAHKSKKEPAVTQKEDPQTPTTKSLAAPISWREAKKRKLGDSAQEQGNMLREEEKYQQKLKSVQNTNSRKNEKKRKAAVVPQTHDMRDVRGPDAAFRTTKHNAKDKITRRKQ